MNKQIKIILLILLGLLTNFSFTQEKKKFVYGGTKGTRNKGTFTVSYYIEHKGRLQQLPDSVNQIDLNAFSEDPKLVVQLSSLKLGLNASFNQIRNSDHAKVFYKAAWITTEATPFCYALSTDTLKLGAEESHYGKSVIHLAFALRNPDGRKQVQLKVKTQTVDGIYNREWKGITVARPIFILPRIVLPTIEETARAQSTIKTSGRSNRRYRRNGNAYAKLENDSLDAAAPTAEDQLWDMIQQDQISGKKENLITHCKLYQMNCKQGVFEDCKYSEEVLFFLIGAVSPSEQSDLVAAYKTRYPNGKFLMHLPAAVTQEKDRLFPIQQGLAQIDFDENALLVNRVKGGNKPYYIGFYDYQKNKELSVKSHRFNKEDLSVSLDELGIPQGMYTVKVMDSKGQLFAERDAVFVRSAMQVPKSAKLSMVLLLFGAMGFLYKKYIHF